MGLWDDIYQLIYKASEKLNETFSEEIRATPDSYLLENKSKIGHGVKRIKGELQPTIDKPYTYQVDQYLKSNVPKVIQDEVKWVLLRKENNGKWRTLKTEPKKGPKVSYSFSSKNLNKTLRLEAFINAAEHKCPPAIEIKPIQGEPKIGRVVLNDQNNNEITESTDISYGDSIKAIIETTNLVGNDLVVELWERDTWSDEGHDPDSADFIIKKTVKVTTENKNLVVDIELLEAYMKKAMNGYFENEGDQHEYYVIVRTKGLVKYSENTANTDIVATEGKIVGFVKSLVNIKNTITPIIEKEHSSPVMIGNSENEEEKEDNNECPRCNADITLEEIKAIFDKASDDLATKVCDELNSLYEIDGVGKKVYEIFELNTCAKRAHFFAQAYVESYSSLKGAFNGESLNYSIKALVSGYPFSCFKKKKELKLKAYEIGRGPYKYFKEVKEVDLNTGKEIIKKIEVKIPSSQRANQKEIANIAYDDANRGVKFKLGNTSKGDGWNYRGRGLLQITGKANYNNTQNIIDEYLPNSGVDISNGMSQITAKQVVLMGVGDWVEKKCHLKALNKDINVVDAITRKINIATKSYDERKEAFKTTSKIFKLDNCKTINKNNEST